VVLDLDSELVAADVGVAILGSDLVGKRKIGLYLGLQDAELVAAQSKGFSSGLSVEKDTGRPSILTSWGVDLAA
jgi:hypothetical protein